MKIQTLISIIIMFSSTLKGQGINDNKETDTIIYANRNCENCPIEYDTIVYRLLKCGLYYGSNGDLAYQGIQVINELGGRAIIYKRWIYGADKSDSLNGGLKEMKFVVDTSSFEFLSIYYWTDKNYVFSFTPTSSGGTIYLNHEIDRQSFQVFGESRYAKDKNGVYYRSSKVNKADEESFEIVEIDGYSDLARDKNHYFQYGRKLTNEEVRKIGISNE